MVEDIKARILETAKKLFGERGYNQVSMRDIAAALNISVGNLTYHYKRKEDLIEAALLEGRWFEKPAPFQNLEELQAFFLRQFHHYKEDAYYFKHYSQLAQVSPRIFERQVDTMRQVHEVYLESFALLQKNGLLRPEELPGQYNGLVHAIRTLSIFGDSSMQAFTPEDSGSLRLVSIWDILYPVLTPKGKAAFKEHIQGGLGLSAPG